ncbi:MAG TPA: hypothetical protein PLU54_04065 [Deltaproteobacteria bacterium]|nr:hypothetical protein [Deltaproteobacteria bacterium]
MQGVSFITGLLPVTTFRDIPLSWPMVTTFLGNSYFFVLSATFLSLFLAGVYTIIKYAPLMLNDFRIVTNNDLPDSGLIAWIAFIIVIPLFLDAGPMILVLWWFLLFWGYLIPSEKLITYFFVFLVLISGWIAHIGSGFLTYTENQLNRQIFVTEHKLENADDIQAISSWIDHHPADAEPMNALAIFHINKGNFLEAIGLLNKGIDLEPDNARYYNHLAIALLASGKTRDALKAFQTAITLMPGNMVYHYNVSRLYQSTYNFYEAEKAIAAASGIDAEGVRHLLDRENNLGKTRYIFESMPLGRQLSRQMKISDDLRSTADALWSFAFGLVPRKMSLFLGIGCIVAFILLSYIPDEKFTKKCTRCGKLYYSGAHTQTGNPMCLQCSWIDTKAKKQVNSIMQHKTEEIKKYKTFSYRKLLRLEMSLPGLGSFLINRTGMAVTRIALLSASVVAIVTGGHFITSFMPAQAENLPIMVRAAGVFCLGLLILRAYKMPPVRFG